MNPDLVARLQRLLDRADIEDAIRRYYRGLDRFDEDLMRSAFHPDAIERHGGWAEGNAWDVSHRLLEAAAGLSRSHTHFVTNLSVDFIETDAANTECYLFAVSRIEDDRGRRDYVVMGRLVDRFERRDGQWKIASRLLVKDIDRIDTIAEVPVTPNESRVLRGRRDRTDPSYR